MKFLLVVLQQLITSDFKSVEMKFEKQGIGKPLIKEYLNKFKEIRDRNKIKEASEKNIDFWGNKDWNEFKGFVDKLTLVKTKTEQEKEVKFEGAKLVAENEDYKVYHITTYDACVKYGSGTKWCITKKDHWNSYILHTKYFLISKKLDSKII